MQDFSKRTKDLYGIDITGFSVWDSFLSFFFPSSTQSKPVIPEEISFTADPKIVPYGGSTTLTWTTSLKNCYTSSTRPYPEWNDGIIGTGSVKISNMVYDTTFTISCPNARNRLVEKSVLVKVTDKSTPSVPATTLSKPMPIPSSLPPPEPTQTTPPPNSLNSDTPNGNIKYIGYYWTRSPDNIGISYIDEVSPYTNIFWTVNDEDAQKARQTGSKGIIDISNCFYEPIPSDPKNAWRVRADWENTWNTNNACKPFATRNSDVTFAFYLLDEPYGHNLKNPDLELAINVLHRDFPSIKVVMTDILYDASYKPNYATPNPTFPAGLDIYSFECYYRASLCRTYFPNLERVFNGQIFATVGAFHPYSDDVMNVQYQTKWYDYLKTNPRVSGILWFLYSDCTSCGFGGTRSIFEGAVKEYHRDVVSREVLCSSTEQKPVCGTNGVTYQNPDKAKCAKADISYYGQCGVPPQSDRIPVGTNDGFTSTAITTQGGGTIPANSIFGWSYDPDQTNISNQVHLYFDGISGNCPANCLLVADATDVIRGDVNTVNGITGIHGFAHTVPSQYCNGALHNVTLYGINTNSSGQNTFIGTKTFTCTLPTGQITVTHSLNSNVTTFTLTGSQGNYYIYVDDPTITTTPYDFILEKCSSMPCIRTQTLTAGKTYTYYAKGYALLAVELRDPANGTKSFTIGSADTTPPTRTNGAPTGQLAAGTTTTTASLATNEAATCKYSTSPGTAYASMSLPTQTGGTNHSKSVTNLVAGLSYAYYIKCSDNFGNTNTDDYVISFGVPSDTTPPIISSVSATSITTTTASIQWATNEPSASLVNYGTTTSYGLYTSHTNMIINHSKNLSGLSPGTLYHYRIRAIDAAGNLATSVDYTFTALSSP